MKAMLAEVEFRLDEAGYKYPSAVSNLDSVASPHAGL
jgi:hypothetical protein